MKDKVLQLINFFNKGEFEKAYELIHPDVTMTTFSIQSGRLAIVRGKERYIQAVENNFGEGDLKMLVEVVITEENLTSISGFYVGTRWDLLKLQNTFKVRFASIFELRDDLIIKHDKHLDTLELLRLSGNSIFQENIESKIENYLKLLSEIGLIRN